MYMCLKCTRLCCVCDSILNVYESVGSLNILYDTNSGSTDNVLV